MVAPGSPCCGANRPCCCAGPGRGPATTSPCTSSVAPPGRCVVIEDSRNGLLAATRAGFPTLVTTSTYTIDEDFTEAARVVPELGDDPVLIELADLDQLAAKQSA